MADPKLLNQPQAYYPDGAPIPAEELPKAIESGAARWKKGERVYVRTADGQLGSVDASEATARGMRPVTQEELQRKYEQETYGSGLGAAAKAGAAGIARGLTLGASDMALSLAPGAEQELRALREHQPVASGVGETVGAIAPVLASGGTSAAARGLATVGAAPVAVARAGSIVERGVMRGLQGLGYTGESLAGRVAARAASMGAAGAVEGAAYGAGQAVSDVALSDESMTAEKFLGAIGRGALWGGALGAGIGGMLPAAGALAQKVKPSKESLRQFAQEQALGSIGKQSDIQRLVARETGEAAERKLLTTGEDLISYEFKTGSNAGQRVFQGAKSAEELAPRITEARKEIGEMLGGVRREIDDAIRTSRPDVAPDVGEFLRRVDDEVLKPLKKAKTPGMRQKARMVERQLADLRSEHEARLLAEVGEPVPVRLPDGTTEMRPRTPPNPPSFAELESFRKELVEQIYPPKTPGGGIAPPPPKSAKYLQQVERILDKHLDESALKALGAIGENPQSYLQLQKQYASFKALEGISSKAYSRSLGNRTASPTDHALGLGAFMGALMSGNVGALGAMAAGGAAAVANKLLRERGSSVLADLAYKASLTDSAVEKAARAIAGSSGKAKRLAAPALTNATQIAEDYDKLADRVRQLKDPAHMSAQVAHVTTELSNQYPSTGFALSNKLLETYRYLTTKLPQPMPRSGSVLTPLAARATVSQNDKRKFVSAARGALDPMSVVEELERGRVDRDAVEALRVVHPQTFGQLRARVQQYVAEREESLPFPSRVFLSVVFDFPGDSSLTPERGAGLQEALNQAVPTPEQEARANSKVELSPKAASAMKLPSEVMSNV